MDSVTTPPPSLPVTPQLRVIVDLSGFSDMVLRDNSIKHLGAVQDPAAIPRCRECGEPVRVIIFRNGYCPMGCPCQTPPSWVLLHRSQQEWRKYFRDYTISPTKRWQPRNTSVAQVGVMETQDAMKQDVLAKYDYLALVTDPLTDDFHELLILSVQARNPDTARRAILHWCQTQQGWKNEDEISIRLITLKDPQKSVIGTH